METIFDTIVTLIDLRFWMFAWVILIPSTWTWRLMSAGAVTVVTGIIYAAARSRMAAILEEPEPAVVTAFIQTALACGIVALVAASIWAAVRKVRGIA